MTELEAQMIIAARKGQAHELHGDTGRFPHSHHHQKGRALDSSRVVETEELHQR